MIFPAQTTQFETQVPGFLGKRITSVPCTGDDQWEFRKFYPIFELLQIPSGSIEAENRSTGIYNITRYLIGVEIIIVFCNMQFYIGMSRKEILFKVLFIFIANHPGPGFIAQHVQDILSMFFCIDHQHIHFYTRIVFGHSGISGILHSRYPFFGTTVIWNTDIHIVIGQIRRNHNIILIVRTRSGKQCQNRPYHYCFLHIVFY